MPSRPVNANMAAADSAVAAVWPSFEEAMLNRQPPEPPALEDAAPVASSASDLPPILGRGSMT